MGDLTGLLKDAAWAIGGGVTTRSVPETLIPSQNSGLLGYGLNIGTAAIGSFAVAKFTKNARAASSFLLGGIVMTVSRVIDDYFGKELVRFAAFNPTGPALLSGDPAYRLGMRGTYQPASFPLPTNSLPALLPAPTPVAAAAGGTGMGRRSWGSSWN